MRVKQGNYLWTVGHEVRDGKIGWRLSLDIGSGNLVLKEGFASTRLAAYEELQKAVDVLASDIKALKKGLDHGIHIGRDLLQAAADEA
jgi:hypothetical protein